MKTNKKQIKSKLLPILVIAIGIVLLIVKIYADSEPGAIPLLLIVLGSGWYAITSYTIQLPH